jgi:hypothetical protein
MKNVREKNDRSWENTLFYCSFHQNQLKHRDFFKTIKTKGRWNYLDECNLRKISRARSHGRLNYLTIH